MKLVFGNMASPFSDNVDEFFCESVKDILDSAGSGDVAEPKVLGVLSARSDQDIGDTAPVPGPGCTACDILSAVLLNLIFCVLYQVKCV